MATRTSGGVHKRSYSPTIDDLRQYNIKRQRLLDDLESLTLSNQHATKHYEAVQPRSTPNTEYIPDIDEFLLQNQDDLDVLESSKHITDIQDVLDPEKLVIPEKLTRISGLSKEDEDTSIERILSRRKMDIQLGKRPVRGAITSEDILLDYEIRKNWSMVKYVPPQQVVFNHWEKWWMNVHKLDEFMRQLNPEDDEMVDEEYEADNDDEFYEGDTMVDDSWNEDEDAMDIDG